MKNAKYCPWCMSKIRWWQMMFALEVDGYLYHDSCAERYLISDILKISEQLKTKMENIRKSL